MKLPCKDFTHTGMTLDSWEFHLTIKLNYRQMKKGAKNQKYPFQILTGHYPPFISKKCMFL